jgi:hypothetical protein
MRPPAENADGLYAAFQDCTVSTMPQHRRDEKWTWVDFAFIAMTIGSFSTLLFLWTRK